MSGQFRHKGFREPGTMPKINMTGGGLHIWHYCKMGEHGKCLGFGSLVRRRGELGKTFVEMGVKGHGFENVYCECPCHAVKEVTKNGKQ